MPKRGILIYVPPQGFEWYRQALELLADQVITDDEAGQRGAKTSIFIRMVVSAFIKDGGATVEALQQIKAITQK